MEDVIKFTNEEQTKIKENSVKINNVFTQLGQLEIEKQNALDTFTNIKTQFLQDHAKLIAEQQKLFDDLNQKYGDGNYNPDTGEFTPLEKQG
jgi:hypothetical protein